MLQSTIREYRDIPARADEALFMVVLPGTVKEESVHLAIRLFVAFQETMPEVVVSIGITQIESTWGREKIIKIAKQAAAEAASLPPPSLCIYDAKRNRFQTLSEAHQ